MRDIIYSTSNTVNNIVTTLYGGYMATRLIVVTN